MKEESVLKYYEEAKRIKLIVIGVDGVLTDGGMYFSSNGDIIRKFNRRDGLGIQLLKGFDIKTAIISSVESSIVKQWARTFRIDSVALGVRNKLHEIEKLQLHYGIKPNEIAYISDDIDEYSILNHVGFGVTVADGMNENKEKSIYVTKLKGGEGAVRETIEIILKCKQINKTENKY
jgi:YrbI family 3-deoxy-D-manno-octulosonate 8-phosphate phosphatase